MSDETHNPNTNAPTPPSVFDNSEREAFISDLAKNGVLTPEQATAERGARGIVEDTRTPGEKTFDAAFPVPEKYDFQLPFRADYRGKDAPTILADNARYSAWAKALQLPAGVAEEVVNRHIDAAYREKNASEGERELFGREQQALALKLVPDLPERAKAAEAVLRAVSGIEIKLDPRVNGAAVTVHLIRHAERLAARHGRKS